MQKRIPHILIALLVIIRISIAVNTYPDGVLYREGDDASISKEIGSRSLIGETVSVIIYAADLRKNSIDGLLGSLLTVIIATAFFLWICWIFSAWIKRVFIRSHAFPSAGSAISAYPPKEIPNPKPAGSNSTEDKDSLMGYMEPSDKKCLSCGDRHLQRIARKWYMHLAPGSRRYLCRSCRTRHFVLLWKICLRE